MQKFNHTLTKEFCNDFLEENYKRFIPLIVFAIFLINPFICLPILFIEVYNRKTYPLILLSILMGLLSIYYFPQGDQFRYREDLIYYRCRNFDEIFDFNTLLIYRNLNIISIALYALSKFQWMTIEIFRFVLVFVGTFLILDIYKKEFIANNRISRRRNFIIFLIIFLSIPFYAISYGLRGGFGGCLTTYGLYLLYKKEKSGYLLLILAASTHYVYLFLAIIYLLSFTLKKRVNNRSYIFIALLSTLVVFVVSVVAYHFVPFFKMIANLYIFGDYGTKFTWDAYRIKEIILINTIPVLILYYLFLKYNKYIPSIKINNLLFLNLTLILISLPFQAILHRMGIISLLLLSVFGSIYYNQIHILKNFRILLLFLTISFSYPYFMHRYAYYHSKIEYFPFSSVYSILQTSAQDDEVYNILDKDGILKKQYLNQ